MLYYYVVTAAVTVQVIDRAQFKDILLKAKAERHRRSSQFQVCQASDAKVQEYRGWTTLGSLIFYHPLFYINEHKQS